MKMKKPLFKTLGVAKWIPKTGKPASSPGTVKYIGRKRESPVKLSLIDYNEKEFTEKQIGSVKECLPFKESASVTWLNVTGVHNESIIHDIGEIFNIHPLVLEDIANTTQNPKVEEFEDYLFVIIKMAYYREDASEVIVEQVSLLIGKNYLVSLQENDKDILEGLRDRIRFSKGKVRKMGSDYLMYAIIDAVVDNYFTVLEKIGEDIEKTEEMLVTSASQEILMRIYTMKRELVYLRKSKWPMREVISTLQRAGHPLIKDGTVIYLRDVYDHVIQAIETVETFREMTTGMIELYLSTASNRMNEVMKVLTIFAAIFIPLTFLAGVYGMNFKYMPEIDWKFAYPLWWVISVALVVGMLIYFKRKKWM